MNTPPASHPDLEVSPSQVAPRWHYFAIFLIPAVLWLINPNWLFQNVGVDPWYYFGEFQHFPRFQNILPTYPGERMTWIAPGYFLVRLLGQVRGIILLHWCVFLLALYLLHDILRRLTDYRTAFVCTLLLGCHPFYIGANGWDYPEGLAIALLLLSLALAMNTPSAQHRRDVYVFLSGMAWFALVYTYVAWLVFTPGYLYVAVRSAVPSRSLWRTFVRIGWLVLCGGLVTTSALWGAYRLLGGTGFFFYSNVMTAIGLARLQQNPWIDPKWYLSPTWLVFPTLAVCLALVCAAASAFRRVRLSRPAAAITWFYLYCVAVMVVMTFRENRLLALDYRTSILMPAVFLTLGITLFRVPELTRPSLFYAITALGALVCVMPLARANLYRRALHWEFIVPVVVLILAVGCWMRLRRANPVSWAAAVVLSSVASFGLTPSHGSAWSLEYRGRDVSERVARAIQAILKRVPDGRYPAFWFTDYYDDPLRGEYQGIMCSFLAQGFSMQHFPKVDQHFESGARIIVLTQHREVTAAASYLLAQAGMPAVLVSQDPIDYEGVSYWMTQMEVLPLSMENLRRGFQSVRDGSGDERFWDFGRSYIRRGNTVTFHKTITVPESGVYQFELRYPASGNHPMFGAVSPDGDGTTWIERSGLALEEGSNQVRWFRLGVKARTPVNLAIQLDCPANAPPVFIDTPKLAVLRDTTGASLHAFDFFLQRPGAEGNLVGNGGFDVALAGWDAAGGELSSGTDCYSGGCAKFAAHGGPNQGVSRRNAAVLHPGDFYSFSAWIKSVTRAPQPLSVGVWDAVAMRWVDRRDITATPQWGNVSFRFQNDSCNPIGITFLKTTSDAGTLLIDEVALQAFVPPGSDKPYTIAMMKAETDFSTWRSLRAVFDSTGKAELQPAENTTEPVPLPLDRWTVGSREKGLTGISITSAGLTLRTPRAAYSAAASYGPLIAPETGRYRFALKYRPVSGSFTFGARPLDESTYLAQDIAGCPAGNDLEKTFWVELERGQAILLRIANNNPNGDGAASFLMEEVTAVEFLSSAGTQGEPSH